MKALIRLGICLLLLMASNAFGADEIYAWGYGQQMNDIFVAISSMTGNKNDAIIKLALALGLFIFTLKNASAGKLEATDIFKFIIMTTVIIELFWSSRGEYIVRDKTNNYVSPAVLQIPTGIGTTFSLFTRLEDALAQKFEDSFSTPNSINFRNAGLGFSMSAHLGLSTDTVLTDSTYMRTFTEYMDNCYWNDVLVNNRDVGADKASTNLAEALKVDAAWLTPVYSGNTSTLMSCQDAWTTLVADLPSQTSKSVEIMAKGYAMSSASYFGKVGDVAQTLFKNSGITSQQYITQMALMNAYNSSTEAVAMATGGSASNIAVAQAVTQASTKAGWAQAGIQAKSTLPLQKAFLTMISIVLLLLMALYSIATADYRGIIEVIKLLFTFLMWTPLVIVINYMMYSRLEDIFSGYTSMDLPNLLNSQILSNQASSYLAFLSYAVTLVTGMSFMLVGKNGTAFVSAVTSMGMSASTLKAAEAAGGMGTVSMNQLSANNTQIDNDARHNRTVYDQAIASTPVGVGVLQGGGMSRTVDGHTNVMRDDHGNITNVEMKGVNAGVTSQIAKTAQEGIKEQQASQSLTSAQHAMSILKGYEHAKAKGTTESFEDATGFSIKETNALKSAETTAMSKTLDKLFANNKSIDLYDGHDTKTYTKAGLQAKSPPFLAGILSAAGAVGKEGSASHGMKSSEGYSNQEAIKNSQAFSSMYSQEFAKVIENNHSLKSALTKSLSTTDASKLSASDSEIATTAKSYQEAVLKEKGFTDMLNAGGAIASDILTPVAKQMISNHNVNKSSEEEFLRDVRNDLVNNGGKIYGSEFNQIVDGLAKSHINTRMGQYETAEQALSIQLASDKAGIDNKVTNIESSASGFLANAGAIESQNGLGVDINNEAAMLQGNYKDHNNINNMAGVKDDIVKGENGIVSSYDNTKDAVKVDLSRNDLAGAPLANLMGKQTGLTGGSPAGEYTPVKPNSAEANARMQRVVNGYDKKPVNKGGSAEDKGRY